MADGSIMAVGRCLEVPWGRTAAGTQVQLAPCYGNSSQQWVQRPDRTLINPGSGRCLTPDSASSLAVLRIQDCTGSSQQLWRTPSQNGREGALSGPGGRCLDIPNNDPRPGAVAIHDCNGTDAQRWVMTGDNALHAAGKCLDDVNAGHLERSERSTSTPATARRRSSGYSGRRLDGQPELRPLSDGGLGRPERRPRASGLHRFLAADLASGRPVDLQGCVWRRRRPVPRCHQWRVRQSGNETPIELWDLQRHCRPGVGYAPGWQVWFNPISGRCLDITNGSPASGNGFSHCAARLQRQWHPALGYPPGGSLLNPMSGRCLDVPVGLRPAGTVRGFTV